MEELSEIELLEATIWGFKKAMVEIYYNNEERMKETQKIIDSCEEKLKKLKDDK